MSMKETLALRVPEFSASTSQRAGLWRMKSETQSDGSEAALIDRAKTGDAKAFMQLIKLHDSAARAVAYSVTLDRNAMDDVLQESYLKAYRSLHRFKPQTNFGAWLCRIVKNTAIDEFRRRRKVVAMSEEALPSVVDSAETIVNTEAVRKALARLPEQQRLAVRLIDGEQLSYADVAHILEVPVGTVSSRVNSARATLRNLLSDYSENAER
jgi:RNA polymerase sigma factor (sigma-70 family)